jgi:DNA invertase Pin-like site-specific DNA recombinase
LIAERTMAGLAAARARGRMGGRPRKMDRSTLMMAMAAMADRKAVASDVAMRLGLTTTTLYVYVNGDGTPKGCQSARKKDPLSASKRDPFRCDLYAAMDVSLFG